MDHFTCHAHRSTEHGGLRDHLYYPDIERRRQRDRSAGYGYRRYPLGTPPAVGIID